VWLHDIDQPLSGETGHSFCLKKAKDCLRIALTTEDPRARLVFHRLAKMWREMADEAELKYSSLSWPKRRSSSISLSELRAHDLEPYGESVGKNHHAGQ
jgi:hypothetical protein